MKNDLPTARCGLKRIEQQVGNDLNDFTAIAHDYALCLKALINDDSLPLSLGTIKVGYLAEQFPQLEFGRLVVVAVKLEHLGSDAAETSYLLVEGGNVSLRLGTGLQRSQQVYEVGNRA